MLLSAPGQFGYVPRRTFARAGVAVAPGWYSLYAIPTATAWRIVVNSHAQRWEAPIDNAVRAKDVGFGSVPSETVTRPADLLRLELRATSADSAELIVHWDHTQVRIPIVIQG